MIQKCWKRSYVCCTAEKKHLTATQLKMSNVSKRRWLRQGSKYWLFHSKRHKIVHFFFPAGWLLVRIRKLSSISERSPSDICKTNSLAPIRQKALWCLRSQGQQSMANQRALDDPSAEDTWVISSWVSSMQRCSSFSDEEAISTLTLSKTLFLTIGFTCRKHN